MTDPERSAAWRSYLMPGTNTLRTLAGFNDQWRPPCSNASPRSTPKPRCAKQLIGPAPSTVPTCKTSTVDCSPTCTTGPGSFATSTSASPTRPANPSCTTGGSRSTPAPLSTRCRRRPTLLGSPIQASGRIVPPTLGGDAARPPLPRRQRPRHQNLDRRSRRCRRAPSSVGAQLRRPQRVRARCGRCSPVGRAGLEPATGGLSVEPSAATPPSMGYFVYVCGTAMVLLPPGLPSVRVTFDVMEFDQGRG